VPAIESSSAVTESPSSVAASSAASTLEAAKAALNIVPAGDRPFYCLTAAEVVRGSAPHAPTGLDYCARGQSLLAARESGRAIVKPLARRHGALEVWTPVYRGVATPPSGGARIGAFVGWLREVLRPGMLAQQALASHPGYALRLRYGAGAAAIAAVGSPPAEAQAAVSRLRNGWGVQSFGPAATLTLLSDGRAAWALAAGVLLSLLIGLAILAFGVRRGPVEPTPRVQSAPPPPQPQATEVLYDPLTGVPARALTLDRAGRMLARAGRQSGVLAGALLIDVDWFKDVNEKLGREAGDQLLQIVAQRLENAMRSQDTVGRLGDDKFLVLVETSASGVRPDALAQRVIEALHRPVELESFGPSFFMTASIGVAFGRYEAADDLLRDAELALKSAKAAGKDRYTLFNASMRSVIEGRGVLEAELNAALQDGQLFLLYEPIWDMGTRYVAAVEALLRWRHPKRGVLSPEEFMPLAEESGLIVPIGRWALEEACNRAAAWEVAGERIGVCVKVSDKQLNREGFVTDIRRALQQSGLQPSRLTLEISETAVMHDVTLAGERLAEIKQLGVKVAIDDFGASGYAYHSDLRRLPLDSLRVDRGSLAASDDEAYRNWLLEAILIVGRELSLAVVAKGVDSQEQAGALRGMGCTMAQGLFMGEPVSAEGVAGLFRAELPVISTPPTPMPTQPMGAPMQPTAVPTQAAAMPTQPMGAPTQPTGAPSSPPRDPLA
jgi:diguanylate cyclase (GGDEF)-like protein